MHKQVEIDRATLRRSCVPRRSIVALCLAMMLFVGNAFGQVKEHVNCEATLTEYQQKHWWTEEREDVIAEFGVPLVTFTIDAPPKYAGRSVNVLFQSSEYKSALPSSNEETGGRYKLELPEDYFEGPDGQIIRSRWVRSFEKIVQ